MKPNNFKQGPDSMYKMFSRRDSPPAFKPWENKVQLKDRAVDEGKGRMDCETRFEWPVDATMLSLFG